MKYPYGIGHIYSGMVGRLQPEEIPEQAPSQLQGYL